MERDSVRILTVSLVSPVVLVRRTLSNVRNDVGFHVSERQQLLSRHTDLGCKARYGRTRTMDNLFVDARQCGSCRFRSCFSQRQQLLPAHHGYWLHFSRLLFKTGLHAATSGTLVDEDSDAGSSPAARVSRHRAHSNVRNEAGP